MAEPNPLATQHLPSFVTAPGETDVLMVIMAFVLLASVMAFGILFFRLHSLPERMAHRTHKLQFEIVAVLCLISLFTHMHIFWIAGLLLAMIDLPDFGTSLTRIAGSAEKLAGLGPGEGAVDLPKPGAPLHADVKTAHGDSAAHDSATPDSGTHGGAPRDGAAAASPKPEIVPPKRTERAHA